MADCAKCDASVLVPEGLEFEEGALCWDCMNERMIKLETALQFDWRPAVEYLKAHTEGEARAFVEVLSNRLYVPQGQASP